MGRPEDSINDYDTYKVDDISVFVRCDIVTKDDVIEVGYSKLFFKEVLTVAGVMV